MRWAQRVSSQSAVCRRSDDKVANRTGGIFGREIEMSSSRRFATPAQHHCSSYRRIHVRYERLGVVARSRGSFSRPCQTLLVRFATFSSRYTTHRFARQPRWWTTAPPSRRRSVSPQQAPRRRPALTAPPPTHAPARASPAAKQNSAAVRAAGKWGLVVFHCGNAAEVQRG